MGQDDDNMPPPHFSKDELNGVNSKIMISAIASLSFVIILVIVLHIYARCLIRRQERRTIALRQLRMTSISVDHLIIPDRPGLDPAVIASLPIFPFKKETTTDDDESQIECSVCLSLLEQNEMVRKLPNCNHTFHSQCIDMWLGSHSTCPVCRTEAEPKPGVQLLPPESSHQLPTAPPLDGTDGTSGPTVKVGGSSSRLSSFRRILSRERSSRRVQSCVQDDVVLDLERQQQQQQ
ncbi:RING-H2 finger protein ATL40-like [Impatiens glandulifera]|uniref:RING-H2 finger protein ATL40-like n=1 Tax=Impatiens glandulifera TaxID=253017 RepID=UPI001FB1358D|nr:RING-H2 finger protein ATL40-like [Impatiens glandulifera]